ncbi:MAG: hypothetical protein ACI86L_000309, partial [Dokdonia sp.]
YFKNFQSLRQFINIHSCPLILENQQQGLDASKHKNGL